MTNTTETPPPSSSLRPGVFCVCVVCGKHVEPARADLVGNGYRCNACTDKADLNDPTGQLSTAELITASGAQLSRARRALLVAILGPIAIAALDWAARGSVADAARMPLLIARIACFAMFFLAISYWRTARRFMKAAARTGAETGLTLR